MGKVIELSRKKVFTLIEAREILPVIRRITDEAHNKVKNLLTLLDAVRGVDVQRTKDIEDKINAIVSEWQGKISKLGAEGKGLWLVDFDSGSGFYCWKYPEDQLEFFHSYTEGFQGRVRIYDLMDAPSHTHELSPPV